MRAAARFAAWIVVAALVGALAACGGEDEHKDHRAPASSSGGAN